MNKDVILFAAQLMNFAVTYGIEAARKISAAAHKSDPTQADWDAAFDQATTNTDKFLERTKNLSNVVGGTDIPANG